MEELGVVRYEQLQDIIDKKLPGTTAKILILCEIHRITISQLAKTLGVSRQTVHNYLNNNHTMPLSSMIKMCELFYCTLDDIFWDKNTDYDNLASIAEELMRKRVVNRYKNQLETARNHREAHKDYYKELSKKYREEQRKEKSGS